MDVETGNYLVRGELTTDRRTQEVVFRWTEMEVTADEDGDGRQTKRRHPRQTRRFATWDDTQAFIGGNFKNLEPTPEPP